ncbi:flp pilus-assembly TadE/G-like family protein [Streptomyces sp. 549]|uniref:Rv3654c family TadE-like protein n=1 Tax=Streptomyces sp. 549 TaxID=3049076 RepID=UPI0024C2EFA5|nr:Rv3654c family TadE-like protein [Streptomyces sp. 549]MDK1476336.1 flp pilus-assembly TadE/G-like family protein [Streptomyces sp. 549]
MWTAVCAGALCAVFALLLTLGQAVQTRHRAGAAADLAALAAADHAPHGTRRACAEARRVAEAQRAGVVRCLVHEGVADLTAEAAWGPYRSQVRSRAGPPAAVR